MSRRSLHAVDEADRISGWRRDYRRKKRAMRARMKAEALDGKGKGDTRRGRRARRRADRRAERAGEPPMPAPQSQGGGRSRGGRGGGGGGGGRRGGGSRTRPETRLATRTATRPGQVPREQGLPVPFPVSPRWSHLEVPETALMPNEVWEVDAEPDWDTVYEYELADEMDEFGAAVDDLVADELAIAGVRRMRELHGMRRRGEIDDDGYQNAVHGTREGVRAGYKALLKGGGRALGSGQRAAVERWRNGVVQRDNFGGDRDATFEDALASGIEVSGAMCNKCLAVAAESSLSGFSGDLDWSDAFGGVLADAGKGIASGIKNMRTKMQARRAARRMERGESADQAWETWGQRWSRRRGERQAGRRDRRSGRRADRQSRRDGSDASPSSPGTALAKWGPLTDVGGDVQVRAAGDNEAAVIQLSPNYFLVGRFDGGTVASMGQDKAQIAMLAEAGRHIQRMRT